MEFKITALPSKFKNLKGGEKDIVDHALIVYQGVLDTYEKQIDAIKETLRQKEIQEKKAEDTKYKPLLKNSSNASFDTNPFMGDIKGKEEYKPTVQEVKTFVYSAWAETLARARTPHICDGQRKKTIRKAAYRNVKNGKFLNKKVRDKMNEYITRLIFGLK